MQNVMSIGKKRYLQIIFLVISKKDNENDTLTRWMFFVWSVKFNRQFSHVQWWFLIFWTTYFLYLRMLLGNYWGILRIVSFLCDDLQYWSLFSGVYSSMFLYARKYPCIKRLSGGILGLKAAFWGCFRIKIPILGPHSLRVFIISD